MYSVKEFGIAVMEILPASVRSDWKQIIVNLATRFFEEDIRLSELSTQTMVVRFLEGVVCAAHSVLVHDLNKEEAQRQLDDLLTEIDANPGRGYMDRTFAQLRQRLEEPQDPDHAILEANPAISTQTQTEAAGFSSTPERTPFEFILDDCLTKAKQNFQLSDDTWALTRDVVLQYADRTLNESQALQKATAPKDLTRVLIRVMFRLREILGLFDAALASVVTRHVKPVFGSINLSTAQPSDVISIAYSRDSNGTRIVTKPPLSQNSTDAGPSRESASPSTSQPASKNNAPPNVGTGCEEVASADVQPSPYKITDNETEGSPSPTRKPVQDVDHLHSEASRPTKRRLHRPHERRLHFAKKTGPKELVTEPVVEQLGPVAEPTIEEPPMKRVRKATSEVARKPDAEPTEKATSKPVKKAGSSQGSHIKERDDYTEYIKVRGDYYYCSYNTTCKKMFPHPSNCRGHIAKEHLKISFLCTKCGKEEPFKPNMHRHMKNQHPKVKLADRNKYIQKLLVKQSPRISTPWFQFKCPLIYSSQLLLTIIRSLSHL